MGEVNENAKTLSLDTIITNVVQVPGVKVNRQKFLAEMFAKDSDILSQVIADGPVQAGYTQDQLGKIANKLILTRTSESSLASFAAGLPGGWAMAATIPADVMQFFGMALRLAQELSYLYGAQDLWEDGEIDDERVRNQLVMYCGVMFGVAGASAGVRVLSAQIAKATLKKLPQQALTKTFWYPLVKQIGKALSIRITKTTVAQGFSKAIPIVGGVISGSLNFASMLPMAKRLLKTLDEANFGYTEEKLNADIIEVSGIDEDGGDDAEKVNRAERVKEIIAQGAEKTSNGVKNLFAGHKLKKAKKASAADVKSPDEILATITKLAELKEKGALTQAEFDAKKNELLNRL